MCRYFLLLTQALLCFHHPCKLSNNIFHYTNQFYKYNQLNIKNKDNWQVKMQTEVIQFMKTTEYYFSQKHITI